MTVSKFFPPLFGKGAVGNKFELSRTESNNKFGPREEDIPQQLFNSGLAFIDIDAFLLLVGIFQFFDAVIKVRKIF